MEFLSLQEPIPEPAAQVTRTDAVVISVGLHLLALVLFFFLPGYLPPSFLEFFAPKPVRVASLRPEAQPLTQPALRHAEAPLRRPRIPLKFAYVKVPNDVAAPKNPLSPLLSDKDRRARQELPTPPGTKKPTLDPHSQGDTIERVRPDPNLASGRDHLEAPVPQGAHQAESDRVAAMRAARKASAAAAAAGPGASSAAGADGEGTVGQSPQAPREDGLLTRIPNAPQTPHGGPPGAGPGGGAAVLSDEARESLRRALDAAAEERKRIFDNPGYLRPGAYGTMSFDTQEFPWGDYERKVHIIIENNWDDRLPLAYRQGLRGYTCAHWMIEKDGTISSVEIVRPSSVAPFDRAVTDALRASSPLPPLPVGFPEAREGASGCFFYNLLPGEIRESGR